MGSLRQSKEIYYEITFSLAFVSRLCEIIGHWENICLLNETVLKTLKVREITITKMKSTDWNLCCLRSLGTAPDKLIVLNGHCATAVCKTMPDKRRVSVQQFTRNIIKLYSVFCCHQKTSGSSSSSTSLELAHHPLWNSPLISTDIFERIDNVTTDDF